jgi:hypothetical protein
LEFLVPADVESIESNDWDVVDASIVLVDLLGNGIFIVSVEKIDPFISIV